MNVFALRDRLVDDYAAYIKSFIVINDKNIREYVENSLSSGLLWPDPLIQLNPSFEQGDSVDELVAKSVLHDECSNVFRIKEEAKDPGRPLHLHRHQSDALIAAKSGDNYVLTTGTGSGKSLAYIVPIVDYVLRQGPGNGIKAIVIYPMNALANSQFGELEKFLCYGYPDCIPPVRFAKYTGQENDEARKAIIASPPDILLTNYVMLELVLTRPYEKGLIKAAQGLQFLVLDELHTYRGRQGADVAMLIARVREACGAKSLQCIGTSATLAGPGSPAEQRSEVAAVASRLFGAMVKPERVIGETLERGTPERSVSDPHFVTSLKAQVSSGDFTCSTKAELVSKPLSIWIESTFGVATESTSGRLVRVKPVSLSGPDGAAVRLSTAIDEPQETALKAIEQTLLAGYQCKDPRTGSPAFAFRLHQFISRGDNVYASIENAERRYITVYGQQYVPEDRSKILVPVAFCRQCGQDYYSVRALKDHDTKLTTFQARDITDKYEGEEETAGYLYHNPDNVWPSDREAQIDRLPPDWLEDVNGIIGIKQSSRKYLPKPFVVAPDGREAPDGLECQYLSAPFRFCLNCGVSYQARQASDIGKLSSLGIEGRSTATTILTLSAIRQLKAEETVPVKARKLLSFTDNRQDASLQAGHFNDFIEVGLMRSALYKATSAAGPGGLDDDVLPQKVFDALDLPLALYATGDLPLKFAALDETKKALRNVIGYRLYHDLRRGWRVTAPNLEQCGLLHIDYKSLQELSAAEEEWTVCHDTLATAKPDVRAKIGKVLLDFMRKELAIKVNFLDGTFHESLKQQSSQRLKAPWAIDENEVLVRASVLFPRASRRSDYGGNYYLSSRSLFGQFLRRSDTFPDYHQKLTLQETQTVILDLLRVLKIAALVEEVVPAASKDDVPGYQIPAASMKWIAGDGSQSSYDPLRIIYSSVDGGRTNPFFVSYYQGIALDGIGLEAHEHTAQVPYEQRQERETAFRDGKLPILYCSPTMELGIDIATLNVVNMRNVPPTPANYAQRSGRAGRSGQPALVFTYCTTGSPHDQYFFKRPSLMVAGAVTPPRIELGNEDLIKAHMHAVWLAATGTDLGKSLKDVVDCEGDNPTLEILPSQLNSFKSKIALKRAADRCSHILSTLEADLNAADWYSIEWLDDVMNAVVLSFDRACDRWRSLYRSALKQREIQNKIIINASRSHDDKMEAKRLRAEAEAQIDLLVDSASVAQSDFYTYRYFASEGFLPGYNFPRLPLSAYIPGRLTKKDNFLSRPRFLAITEFGPQSIIYHEGSKYLINKVIMPVGEESLLTTSAKVCDECGYLHSSADGSSTLDLCEHCGQTLNPAMEQLFRLQNVSAKRRERINCDEEERFRLGYELRTGIRFATHGGKKSIKTAVVIDTEGSIATISYGGAATLWRINLGWLRRQKDNHPGFILDTERGYWAKRQGADDDDQDPIGDKRARVIPYVEDRRNCLLLKPLRALTDTQMSSLKGALKQAIQIQYQLEDSELAAEALPDDNDQRVILFYEAAEGGAGVLRQTRHGCVCFWGCCEKGSGRLSFR